MSETKEPKIKAGKRLANKILSKSKDKPLSTTTSKTRKSQYAQFLTNSDGVIEHVVLPVEDWERLANLDPVYKAKNKLEGLQLNVMLPTGKVVKLPHAVAVMVLIHGIGLLKSWRLYRGHSQNDFEDDGVRQTNVYQFERSNKNRLSTLEKMSSLYGCELDQVTPYIIKECDKEN